MKYTCTGQALGGHDAICQQFRGETQRFNRNGDTTNERRDEYDHLWPRNPELKELKKKIDDKSHLSTARRYGRHPFLQA